MVVAPGASAVKTPLVLLSAVMTAAVPLQVAVPLPNMAVVGAIVAPYPGDVTVRCVPLAIVFAPVKATVAAASMTLWPKPRLLASVVITSAVPLQLAVPLLSAAVVGAVVAPYPSVTIVSWVPLAIVFVAVKVTVAVALVTPLKLDRLQYCPTEPVIVPPEVYVGLFVTEE